MALPSLLMMLIAVAMATGAHSASEENELDHGYWNYREGGKLQTAVCSLACYRYEEVYITESY